MWLSLRSGLLLGAAATVAMSCHGESLEAQNGRCGPTPHLLASAAVFPAPDAAGYQSEIAGMAVDGADLYFSAAIGPIGPAPAQAPTMTGALMHVSTFGGAATQMASGYVFAAPAVVTPTSVIVEATNTSSINILSVPRSGGAAAPLVTLIDDTLLTQPVTDGTSVYFTASAGIESVPLAPGASPAVPAQLTSEYAASLGVFGPELLLLLGGNGQVEGSPLGPSDAGSETLLGTGFAAPVPNSLIACGTNACWIAGGAIEQMDPAGGTVTALASLPSGPLAQPSTLLYDGTNFFVLGTTGPYITANAAIARVPAKGGAAVIVATLPPLSAGLAVDDACVYFGTSTGIFSLLKDTEGVVVP
jgi:hypothetical protein